VRTPKAGAVIAAQLRSQIVRGELKPGDTLPFEVELMAHFGVSRPTLREAFRILEAESLLSVRRGSRGGPKVLLPDESVASAQVGLLLQLKGTTIADVYEARMVIEPAAAGLLAQRRTRVDLADLTEAISALETLVEARHDGNDETQRHELSHEWTEATSRFHQLVLERSRNQTLAVQSAVLREIVARHLDIAVERTFEHPATPRAFQRMIRSFKKLVTLVEARDAEGAQAHWRAHMEVGSKILIPAGSDTETIVDLFD
jgi:DNA-binding FadR family transcriptional regulator